MTEEFGHSVMTRSTARLVPETPAAVAAAVRTAGPQAATAMGAAGIAEGPLRVPLTVAASLTPLAVLLPLLHSTPGQQVGSRPSSPLMLKICTASFAIGCSTASCQDLGKETTAPAGNLHNDIDSMP